MRRTRGEIVRLRVAAGRRLVAVAVGFLAAVVLFAGVFVSTVLPVCGAAGAEAFAGAVSLWVCGELDADCGKASTGESTANEPQRAAATSTHHFVESDRTTFFCEDTLLPENLPLITR